MNTPMIDENEETELWKEYRRIKQAEARGRLQVRSSEIKALRSNGFDVRELTPYQFRVDGQLDLFPTHKRFHFILGNKRGGYQNAITVATRFLRTAKG